MLRKKIHKQSNINTQSSKLASITKEGFLGLKSLDNKQITDSQIEAARRCITRITKRNCKLWIRIKCNIPLTKKSIGSRMGKGCGAFHIFVHNLKKGTIIFEVFYSNLVSKALLEKALVEAGKKLSIPVKLYKKKVKSLS